MNPQGAFAPEVQRLTVEARTVKGGSKTVARGGPQPSRPCLCLLRTVQGLNLQLSVIAQRTCDHGIRITGPNRFSRDRLAPRQRGFQALAPPQGLFAS